MVKKTRIKIVLMVEAIIALTFFIVCSSVLVTSYVDHRNQTNNTLDMIISRPVGGWPQKPAQGRSFLAHSMNSNIVILDFDQRFFDEDEVKMYVGIALKRDSARGQIENISYKVSHREDFVVVAGIDISIQREMLEHTLVYMLSFGISGLVVLGFIMWLLTGWIMNPIKKNIEAQRIFVSDASHELKTPITAILANLDVIESEYGETKWIFNVKNQAERLSLLSAELLMLSKLDEIQTVESKLNNLSQILEESLLSLESVAYEQGKEIDYTIEKECFVLANENSILKFINVFLNNAITHSSAHSIITIKLFNRQTPILIIENKTDSITIKEKDLLFNRFYRGDNSRSRETGGSGLGLAIAKKISDNNKWKVSVEIKEKESIKFEIRF